MYEESERAIISRGLKNGLTLDLKDQMTTITDMKNTKDEVLTSKDLGMLELTSPELERIILDPMDDRFLGGRSAGFVSESFRQQQRPGHSVTTTDQLQDFGFDSRLNGSRYQLNLPEPALAAAASFDEDSDSEPGGPYTYTTLVPPRPKATPEFGYAAESFLNMNSKSASVQSGNSTAPSVGNGGCSARVNTLLPTAVHPGVSYLPLGTLHSVPTRLKEEPMQMVPCLDWNPVPSFHPMSPMNMEDQDRIRQERKRERNRLAARKCRTKKLEQVVHLEERVNELKEQNRALGDAASTLQAQMSKLQSQIAQHISCGCPIMISTTATTMMKLESSSSPFAA